MKIWNAQTALINNVNVIAKDKEKKDRVLKMRNYQLMRNILNAAAHADEELSLADFSEYANFEELQVELNRLKGEGLIEHNMAWKYGTFCGGVVSSITEAGREFQRNIENEKVWFIVEQTLKDANLDLSYPLLKEVSDEIVKRYVMSKIPKDL